MAQVSARRALEYAISPPMLRLFGVVLLGWVLLPLGIGLVGSGPLAHLGGIFAVLVVLEWVVGLAIALVGLLALYGGLAALLYKIVVDALGDADRPRA